MSMTRTEKVEIRLTEEEKKELKELAKNHSLDMASYGRMKMLTSTEVQS